MTARTFYRRFLGAALLLFLGGCVVAATPARAATVPADEASPSEAVQRPGPQDDPEALADAGSEQPARKAATVLGPNLASRDALFIVGAEQTKPFVEAAIAAVNRDYVLPQPTLRLGNVNDVIGFFCAGVGPQYPDVVVTTRIMRKSEYDECIQHGVDAIVELQIGVSAFVVVAKRGDPIFDVTPRLFYLGLARELPADGGFVRNTYTDWNQIDDFAADVPIAVIVPPRGSLYRYYFDALLLEGGCRHLPEIDAITAAAPRVKRCTTLRSGTQVIETEEPYAEEITNAVVAAAPGTLAMVLWPTYLAQAEKLELLPFNGVVPTQAAIETYTYDMTDTMRFYFKRAHVKTRDGGGVLRGIPEFMKEVTSDEAAGRGGYFEKLGLIPLPPATLAQMRRNVVTFSRFGR